MAEAQRQKQYYNQKIGTMGLKPGELVLVKADAFQGKRKIKDRWEDKPHEVVHQIMTDVPSYEVGDQHGHSCVLHDNWQLLIMSEASIPLQVGVYKVWDRCTSPTPVKPTSGGSDSKTTPHKDDGVAITQCQARKTSLRWINRKIWLLLRTSAGAPTEDGWRMSSLTEWPTVSCAFGGGIHVSAHRCHWIADWITTTTVCRTGSQ